MGPFLGAGARHQIRFEDTVNQYKRYFVIGHRRYRNINALIPIPPTSLKNPGNRVDYIFITHPDFAESITPLVEFRKAQGLKTLVVDINDIYNEFSDGLFNPFALLSRGFCGMPITTISSPHLLMYSLLAMHTTITKTPLLNSISEIQRFTAPITSIPILYPRTTVGRPQAAKLLWTIASLTSVVMTRSLICS